MRGRPEVFPAGRAVPASAGTLAGLDRLAGGALVQADDLASVVEVVGLAVGGGEWVIDRGEGAVLEQEAVADLVGIHVEAHDVAAVVDAEGDGRYGTGEAKRGEAAVRRSEIDPGRSRGIEIEADGLPASVDVDRRGLQGAGDVVRGVNPLVEEEPVKRSSGIDVGAHDLAAVVEA